MIQLKKVVSTLLTLSSTLMLTGIGFASTAQGAQLTSATDTLSNNTPSASSKHLVKFTTATAGTIGAVKFVFSNTASGSTEPAGMSTTSASIGAPDITLGGSQDSNWNTTLDLSTDGTIILKKSSGDSYGSNSTLAFNFSAITNNSMSATCDTLTNSRTCWLHITTYNSNVTFDNTTAVDTTTVTYTVANNVLVSAVVDPILKFTVAGVAGGSIGTNDAHATAVSGGTTTTSTATTIAFGDITVGTAKLAQQSLTIQTNANNGYTVYQRFVQTGSSNFIMGGSASTSNKIVAFQEGTPTWTNPTSWASPTGSQNAGSAQLGMRTTDYTTYSNYNADDKWGPVVDPTGVGSGYAVVTKTAPDNGGSSTYVSYKIEANAFQPADSYSGTMVYNVVANY